MSKKTYPLLMDPSTCRHTCIIRGLCCICGADLEKLNLRDTKDAISAASVSMVHSVPELRITKEYAEQLGKADQKRLIDERKLVLLVDLDQTLIHTTHETGIDDPKSGVHLFHLWPPSEVPNQPVYRTKFRPHIEEFFESMSKLFEFHICTFGARNYAHKIASLLDPEQKYFASRILSRDECFDPHSKTGNMKELFPCGDSMVCIIDDREDVWNFAANLVLVKPYTYFQSTGDINSPYRQRGNIQYQSSGHASADSTDNEDLTDHDDDDSQLNDATELEALLMQDCVRESTETKIDLDVSSKLKEDQASTNNIDATDTPTTSIKETLANFGQKRKLSDEDDVNTNGAGQMIGEPSKSAKLDDNSNTQSQDCASTTESPKNYNIDDDDYLLYLQDILRTVHKKFYEDLDEKRRYLEEGDNFKLPDLKEIIPLVKKTVLAKVNAVFSGVIPTNCPLESNKAYILAKAFGAKVSKDIIDDGFERTTHLIASKPGTAKVLQVQKLNRRCKDRPKIWIVTPQWLYESAERWSISEEMAFPLKSKSSHISSSSSSSSAN